MNTNEFNDLKLELAERSVVFLKMNISGPSGSGKTFSALLMAYGITKDWTKIAVIDSENRSASLYSHLGKFQIVNLPAPYSPERYIQCIDICLNAKIQVVIIDSSTHEWDGKGGCKEINENLAQSKYKGNTWSAWNETTPRHDKFIQKVLQSPVHIITCTRSKMETVMGDDKKVKKVGMKDIQRDGWEYELTVSLNLDRDTHRAMTSKDRTNLFEGRDPFVITSKTGEEIVEWCNSGKAAEVINETIKDVQQQQQGGGAPAATASGKPKITDAAILKACERFVAGETDMINKLVDTFELTPEQSEYMQRTVVKLRQAAPAAAAPPLSQPLTSDAPPF